MRWNFRTFLTLWLGWQALSQGACRLPTDSGPLLGADPEAEEAAAGDVEAATAPPDPEASPDGDPATADPASMETDGGAQQPQGAQRPAAIADDGGAPAGAGDPDAGQPTTGADARCQADLNAPQKTDYAMPGPYPVGTFEVVLQDSTRPIAATDQHLAAPARVLVTTLYYPAAAPPLLGPPPVAAGGPFPMLMYSHGYSSSRSEALPLATHAASHGYFVVVPEFPLTSGVATLGAPDIEDAVHQPGDVTFLIDQMLAFSADPAHPFANAIDESRIGAVGVSLGGFTTLLVAYHPRFSDPRIKAAMPIAPLSSLFAQGFYHTRELPLLLLHGDQDAFLDYEQNARRAFERAAPNARLITVKGGTHAAFGAAFDAGLVPLLNALVGPADADPSNPDGLGCGAVGARLQMTRPEFAAALGGPEDFIEAADVSVPCQGDEYTRPAIDPALQGQLAARSAVAFFEAHLGPSAQAQQDGCRYLLKEISTHPAVTLE